MKNAILLIMVATSMSVAYGQRSEGQSYFQYYTENDKLLHAGAGFAIAGLGTTMYATAFSIKLSRNWNEKRMRKNRVVAVDLVTGKKVRLR